VSLLLHGVVRAGHRLPDSSRFTLVPLEDLAVVVSDRLSDRVLSDREATAHLAGLCALLPGGPVLPLRIGTTAVDPAAARAAVLAFGLPVLRQHLDRLDGLAELHVRLAFSEDDALNAVYREVPVGLTSVIAQGEQIVRDVEAWRRKQADALLSSVAARGVVLLDSGEPAVELRALLVELDQVEVVRAAVAALSGVTATCIGPLPAFHFLDLAPQPMSRWGW
jgi:hypothetical protein